jgi:hypothetical protein
MPPSGQAVATAPANDVTFAAHEIAWPKIGDVRSDLDNFAHKLVADH